MWYSQLVWLWPLLLFVILPPSLVSGATGQIKYLNYSGTKSTVCPARTSLLLLQTNTFFFPGSIPDLFLCVYLLCKA